MNNDDEEESFCQHMWWHNYSLKIQEPNTLKVIGNHLFIGAENELFVFDVEKQVELLNCGVDGTILSFLEHYNEETSEKTVFIYTHIAKLYAISLNQYSIKEIGIK